MITVTPEKTVKLHEMMCAATGGDCGVRDIALLDSAVSSAFMTFDGVELYPTTEEKCVRISISLIKNHAFTDGNKRIGMFVLLILLSVNGINIAPTDEEIARVGVALASGEMSYDGLLRWIEENKI